MIHPTNNRTGKWGVSALFLVDSPNVNLMCVSSNVLVNPIVDLDSHAGTSGTSDHCSSAREKRQTLRKKKESLRIRSRRPEFCQNRSDQDGPRIPRSELCQIQRRGNASCGLTVCASVAAIWQTREFMGLFGLSTSQSNNLCGQLISRRAVRTWQEQIVVTI